MKKAFVPKLDAAAPTAVPGKRAAATRVVAGPSRAREDARRATFEACAKARPPESQRVPTQGLPDECDRVRLIGDLTRLAQEPLVPESQRRGCLELIGWLARRMADELPHTIGCHGVADDDDEPSPPSRRPRRP